MRPNETTNISIHVRRGGGAEVTAAGQRQAVKVIRERPPGPEGSRTLRLRLDANPDDATVCCGPSRVYVTDLTHKPRFTSLDWSNDGVLSAELPMREPAAIHANIAVPDYGRVWVTLDNAGAGYGEGNREPLSLLKEAVKSRIARCERRITETMLASPPSLNLDRSKELLESGKLADALREAIIAGEEIELAYSQATLSRRGCRPRSASRESFLASGLAPGPSASAPTGRRAPSRPTFFCPAMPGGHLHN